MHNTVNGTGTIWPRDIVIWCFCQSQKPCAFLCVCKNNTRDTFGTGKMGKILLFLGDTTIFSCVSVLMSVLTTLSWRVIFINSQEKISQSWIIRIILCTYLTKSTYVRTSEETPWKNDALIFSFGANSQKSEKKTDILVHYSALISVKSDTIVKMWANHLIESAHSSTGANGIGAFRAYLFFGWPCSRSTE